MNISIEKKTFMEAVHTVARFAERKSATLPALSAVLIIAGDDGIKMRATNLETGIDYKLPGDCKTDGVVAIPATVLYQFASTLAHEGKIDIEKTGETVSLTSGNAKSSIKTVPYEDFPSISLPENQNTALTLPGTVLRSLFATVASCASVSTIRPELASLSISIEGGVLTAVATDSFRLVEKKIALVQRGMQGKFLIPAKNALEIAQALPDEEIAITFDEHQCAFTSTASILVSRLTNASYPDYRQIIPKEFSAEATVLRKDFDAALKRMTVFSDSFQKVRIAFDPKKSQMAFFARNTDIGESTETITAHISGSVLELSFNHRYLSTVLSLTAAENLSLSAAGIGRPLIIRGTGDATLLYLVSPMNQ